MGMLIKHFLRNECKLQETVCKLKELPNIISHTGNVMGLENKRCNLRGNINWSNVNNGSFTAVPIAWGTKVAIRQGNAHQNLERFSKDVTLECHITFKKDA